MPVTDAPVLVTGATGFIGSQIVKQLLDAGYRVRGTTRDVEKANKGGVLTALAGADQRLELFEADLLDSGAFDEPAAGCKYVMHVASPYITNVNDPQRDLLDPAVNGTLSVLKACVSAGTVKRVVLTSSFAAMMRPPEQGVFTEADWNTTASLDRSAYAYSKTMAERAAWDFLENNDPGFDLVVINPPGVIGPSIVPRVNETDSFFIGMTNGIQPAIVAIDWPFVDVRDVARIHLLAMETPSASGRYLTAAGNATSQDIRTLGKEVLGTKYKFPALSLDRGIGVAISRILIRAQRKGAGDFLRDTVGRPHIVDNTKVKTELGIEFRDLDETIRETWQDLDRLGFLGRRVRVGTTADL